MEIPDLVRERLGDEEIRAGVTLGDEDAVCLTETRTLVYRGEGLLSDESITIVPHDVDRIDVKEGRRKTSFTMEFVDGTESFSVPSSRGEKVLELLIEGVLGVAEVTSPEESVRGIYRFSELTLILTDERLVKHIGSSLWDEDFEEFPFADLTGLDFEEGSVATQIVISIDGRPQRIKAPNDDAPKLRQTLEQAVFAYHDVDSLDALNEAVGIEEEDGDADEDASPRPSDLTLDDGIDPLVGGGDDADAGTDGPGGGESPPATGAENPGGGAGGIDDRSSASGRESEPAVDDEVAASAATAEATAEGSDVVPDVDPEAVSQDDIDAIGDQLEALTTAVKRQNKLLRKQQQTVKQLIQELRQGR